MSHPHIRGLLESPRVVPHDLDPSGRSSVFLDADTRSPRLRTRIVVAEDFPDRALPIAFHASQPLSRIAPPSIRSSHLCDSLRDQNLLPTFACPMHLSFPHHRPQKADQLPRNSHNHLVPLLAPDSQPAVAPM
jgi:hypothetical protein